AGAPERSRAGRAARARARCASRGSPATSAAGAAHPVDELTERATDAVGALALRQGLRVRARDDHIVGVSGQALRLLPERLAQHPLHARAVDGAADTARHRQAQPRAVVVGALLARERVEDEVPVGLRAALPVDALELGTA